MNVDIGELLRLETELKNQREDATSSVGLDAKLNMLKYLQAQTVFQYQAAYDSRFYELNKEGGLECLREIVPHSSKTLLQPKVLELQDGVTEDQLFEKALDFFLADAKLAKQYLDELVTEAAGHSAGCEVQCVEVKSRQRTQQKASESYGGDVRKVTDMARVAVICDTPQALKAVYSAIRGFLKVSEVLTCKRPPILEQAPYKVTLCVQSRLRGASSESRDQGRVVGWNGRR